MALGRNKAIPGKAKSSAAHAIRLRRNGRTPA
jgi:hypothetical protein